MTDLERTVVTGGPRWAAVVPTLGTSLHLEACVEALRADGGDRVEIVVVAQPSRQGAATLPRLARELAPRVDRWIELPDNRGFTGGTNAGIRATTAPWVATVNDDALVRPGWSRALLEVLEGDPGAAAAQGVNLQLGDPRQRLDGFGLGWNRWWQAVQLGRGRELAALEEELAGAGGGAREVFGVSATAAIYRRAALERVDPAGRGPFDEGLVSWYEDAELAVRLRRDGWRAWSVPAARAEHAGGTTGGRRPVRYGALLYGNRWLVVARLLGRRFPRAVPRLLARDLRDLGRRPDLAPAVLLGWLRAARHLPRYASRRPPGAGPAEGG